MEAKRVSLSKDGIGLMLTEDEAQAFVNAIGEVEIRMGWDMPHIFKEMEETLAERKVYRNNW